MLTGGSEEPCIPRGQIPKWEEKFGRPCPRVELEPEAEDAAMIAMHGLERIVFEEGPYAAVADSIMVGVVSAMAREVGAEAASRYASIALAALADRDVVEAIAAVKRRATEKHRK